MDTKEPRVGVGVYIFRNGKVLLGKRLKKDGNGMWHPPGGILEFGEPIVEGAKREAAEECGLSVENLRLIGTTEEINEPPGTHFITLHLMGESTEGDPQVLEPDKCEGWDWYEWDKLPTPLFWPVENLIKSGFNPNNV